MSERYFPAVLILVVISTFVFLSISKSQQETVLIYPTVQRVFMHQPGQYSFVFLDGTELKTVGGDHQYKLIADVPLGSPMWAKVTDRGMGNVWVDIHIHSANDINGGEFEIKKGRGSTETYKTSPLEQ